MNESGGRDKIKQMLAQGMALHRGGQLAQAAAWYERALQEAPRDLDALHMLGIVLAQDKQLERAVQTFDRAIAVNAGLAPLHNSRGIALKELGRLDAAIESYGRAVALSPGYGDAWYNRAIALGEAGRLEDALASYERAIALQPDHARAWFNRGFVLNALKRCEEAIASYDRAIAARPDYAEAFANRGLVLHELNRWDQALASFDQAIALKPDYAAAYAYRGATLNQLKRFEQAIGAFDTAIALDPALADAHCNRGAALSELDRHAAALASYRQALALEPDYEFLFGTILRSQTMICDWSGLAEGLARYEQQVRAGKKATRPFAAIGLVDDPALQKIAAQTYCAALYPQPRPALAPLPRRDRIRIGYFSADLREHPMAHLLAGVLERHDRARLETYAFSFAPPRPDRMRNRLAGALDRFIDVHDIDDAEVARRARALGIDIAIDLMGHTADARPGIFAERAAPVQASYLGHPGTTGAPFIDYVIADAVVIPEERRADFTEKVVWLAHSYQANDDKRAIAPATLTRAAAGLPERGFVFCSFNNSYKIMPQTFARWMAVLQAVEGSVLWLLDANQAATENLRREAARHGVDPARLAFGARMRLDEHLARHRLADLFLDTLPCNAHTTASDALWAGLPVLTCMGQSFASRVAGSLLKAIELPQLIAPSPGEYQGMAIELARDHGRGGGKLAAIRQQLARNRLTSPLFDTALFARQLEAAYRAMYERSQAGLAPDHIAIDGAAVDRMAARVTDAGAPAGTVRA